VYVSQNKQHLFPYTALIGWCSQPRGSVLVNKWNINQVQTQFCL
jgi:hypothetical protein